MIVCIRYLFGESFPGPFRITGPANDQLRQMPVSAFALLIIVTISSAELKCATIVLVEPLFWDWTKTLWKLGDNYYPGDVGCDPLGLKPTNTKYFANMQTKEL